jgi:hypothetical protein
MTFTSKWTEREKAILKQHFPYISAKEISKALPARSPKACNDMARQLGVKKGAERLADMGRENIHGIYRTDEPETAA